MKHLQRVNKHNILPHCCDWSKGSWACLYPGLSSAAPFPLTKPLTGSRGSAGVADTVTPVTDVCNAIHTYAGITQYTHMHVYHSSDNETPLDSMMNAPSHIGHDLH